MAVAKELNYLFDFPLTADSRVFEVGAYEGEWSIEINRRYGCTVYTFEPLERFYQAAAKNIAENPRIHLIHAAVGDRERIGEFSVKGNMTGEFAGESESERCHVVPIAEVLAWPGGCDLLALNCEGGEFAILESILVGNKDLFPRHLLVQFHPVVPNCEARYEQIQKQLAEYYETTYIQPWIWEKRRLKCQP